MKTMAVEEIKTYYIKEKIVKRKIGILDGKAKIEFMNDFKMTTEELCGLDNQRQKWNYIKMKG